MNKEKLKEEIKEISELGENWDGYGAGPIKKEIIDKTNEIIDFLNDSILDPDVVPSCCGIQLEWENGEKGIEIYIEDDLDSLMYLRVYGKSMDDWTEGTINDLNEITYLLDWVYRK